MPEWAWAIIGVVTPPLLSYIIGLFLPRRRTYGWGYQVGRILTRLGQRRIGAGWERIEDRVKATVADFVEGVYDGLDSDDAKAAKS